jgi:hypothetical protein
LIVLGVGALSLILAACSNGGEVAARGDATGTPVPVSGGAAASCVEQYSPETLEKREVAFDGTVEAVTPAFAGENADEPGEVRFRVQEWFAGGSGQQVTLKHYSPGEAAVTSAGGPGLTTGARLLVSGDGGFVWECGFTQPYSAEAAAEWRAALAG